MKVYGQIKVHNELVFPALHRLFWLLAADVSPPVLGDQSPVWLDHDQGGDTLDTELLLQIIGQGGAVLGGQPVAVRLLHVGQHVLVGSVRRDEHDLHVVNLLVKILEHRRELTAGRTPMGGEIK